MCCKAHHLQYHRTSSCSTERFLECCRARCGSTVSESMRLVTAFHSMLMNHMNIFLSMLCTCVYLKGLISQQNGSIMEGLRLWKRNIDKRIEGVEECFICYAVIHATSYDLPRVPCRTCKKKFHSSCLVSTDLIKIITIILTIMCSFLCHFFFGAQGPLHETK